MDVESENKKAKQSLVDKITFGFLRVEAALIGVVFIVCLFKLATAFN